jgi:transcriptional regulator with XRE-family HTH domain
MAVRSRRAARSLGMREAAAIAGNLARDLRATRRRRHLKQAELADKVGISQAQVSRLEAGAGARTSIETWIAIGIALERPLAIGFSRDTAAPLQDAGHLAAQELLIRLATTAGWQATFEAPSNPADPRHVTDVLLRHARPALVLAELWNRLDDLGAGARSSDRKLAEVRARERAPLTTCWFLVDTAANRALVRRYPAILRARFTGSSGAWVRALVAGELPPSEPGLVWIDVRSGRLRPLRLRSGGHL